VPQFVFSYSAGTFVRDRKASNSKQAPLYSLPPKPFGIAHLGIVDKNKDTLPITITTSIVYENPQIEEGENARPKASNVTLNVTVSKLVPNVSYKLYKYDNEAKIPTSSFNLNAKNAISVKSISSATGSYAF